MTNYGDVQDYKSALAYLDGGRNPDSRPLQHMTILHSLDNGDIAVRYHETDVVTYHTDESVTLDSGGWRTPTTKTRINDYNPWSFIRVYQDKGLWHVANQENQQGFPFADGMRVSRDGKVAYSEGAPPDTEGEKQLQKQILKYAREFGEAVMDGLVPIPSGGDCWICMIEGGSNTDHLMSHMEESYFVPRLLYNAFQEMNVGNLYYSDWQQLANGEKPWFNINDRVRDAVKRYMRRHLGLAQ